MTAFADAVRTLANQIEERRKHVATEEATKQALILPFLALLGYDICGLPQGQALRLPPSQAAASA